MTRTNCDGDCADIQSDASNCGACGNVCVGVCQNGECHPHLVINLTKEANGPSFAPSISADGTWVAFATSASNLAGDLETGAMIYDHGSGSIRRASFSATDAPAPAYGNTQVSADGRFVVFATAMSVTSDDTNGTGDVYRVELASAEVQRVSIYPDADTSSWAQDVTASEDGNVVAFQETHDYRVYARNISADTTVWVAPEADDDYTWRPALSGDGRYVGFDTRSPTLTDGTGQLHVFVENLETGKIQLVSSSSTGTPGNSQSLYAALSRNGGVAAFQSDATNLVEADTNGVSDVFVKELADGTTTRVSLSSAGSEGDSSSFLPSLSADGRYVAFFSYASNFDPRDKNTLGDFYVHDRVTKKTKRVSVDETGTTGSGMACQYGFFGCSKAALSENGDIVAFETSASDLVPGSAFDRRDIYWVNWKLLPDP